AVPLNSRTRKWAGRQQVPRRGDDKHCACLYFAATEHAALISSDRNNYDMRDFSAAIEKIKLMYGSMSRTDKALAAYVIEHHREIAFSSVARVGQMVKVSPATVVRFANHLGLSGYAELQALARRALRDEVDSVSKLQKISSQSTPQTLFHAA